MMKERVLHVFLSPLDRQRESHDQHVMYHVIIIDLQSLGSNSLRSSSLSFINWSPILI